MKKDTHPAYGELVLILKTGERFITKSAIRGRKELILDVDFRTHPAWTGGQQEANDSNKKIISFKDKFGDLSEFSN